MSKKSKIKLAIIFIFILIITTGCKLIFPIDEKNNNNDEKAKFPPDLISPVPQLYNEDGTEFKGNGKIYIYCDNGEDAREFYYADVINGIQFFDNSREAYSDFFTSWIDNPPLFSIILSDYTSSDISVEIINIDNNVTCSANQGSFYGYRFYDDDNPDEYKIVENMRESEDENGNITRLFFNQYFCFGYPEEGYRIIKGELNYTQILNDHHGGKTEKADVKIIYDMDFGYFVPEKSRSFLHDFTYTKAIYTILEEDSSNIHYKADITIGLVGNMTKEDYQSSTKRTLLDKHFRIRK